MSVLALIGATGLTVLPATAAAEECPNAAFRAGPSSHLPDCRAYEMVTPPFKDAGGPALPQISPDGSSVLLTLKGGAAEGLEGMPDIISFGPGAYYSTHRTASGWVTIAADPPTGEYEPAPAEGLTDLTGTSLDSQTTAWLERPVGQPGGTGIDFFLRRPDHSIVEVGPGLPPSAPPETPREQVRATTLLATGVSADASHLFFNVAAYHWPFDKTQSPAGSLYEYIGTGNTTPMLVGVDSSGKQIGECGDMLGGGMEAPARGTPQNGQNAVSTNGSTAFFTVNRCGRGGPPVAEVFARIDNGLPDARTVAISEPSKEDCSACDTEAAALANAEFKAASEDGSKVFFSTTQPLLGGDTSLNIYEYDFDAPAGKRIVRVSGGDATVANPTAECIEVPQPLVSEDGSHVYFVAKGVLTRTPNGRGESALAGASNLYVFERDASYPAGRTAFIAQTRLIGSHEPEANVTPDGRFLVFTSSAHLTADDTGTTQQVFEYDAQTGAMVRVSIGEDGFNHNGNVPLIANGYGFPLNNATIVSPFYSPTYESAAYWSRLSVSADGAYVFFQSPVGLTPQALDQQAIGYVNGNASLPIYANNIYEYHAGRVSLISDGQDFTHGTTEYSSSVRLWGTDASGADVFFSTVDRLVGQDADTNTDIYDARIGGGFPGPAEPPPCSGEACQGALSGAPTLLSPGSEFQAGSSPPLASEPVAKPTSAKKRATRKPKRKKAGGGRTKRRGRKANVAALGGRANRKAGRS